MRHQENTPSPIVEPSRSSQPHIATLESMEEQAELQGRLALLFFQFSHHGYESALNPCAPETVDMEIRNSAMGEWVTWHAGAFRKWVENTDIQTPINMGDYKTLYQIMDKLLKIEKKARKADSLEKERQQTMQ